MEKIEIIKDKNYLVNKSNKLVFAKTKLNENALKIFRCLICMIKKDDTEFQEYLFTSKDFQKLTNSKHKNVIVEMVKSSRELKSKAVKIDLGKEILETNMIISFKYEKAGSYVKYMLHPDLKPFLLNLKNNYLSYDIKNILSLKSNYSIRLYELLKHHYNLNVPHTKNPFIVFKINLDELKEIFQIPKSYTIVNIKKHILEKSKSELLEKTDIFFNYELNKKYGRKYDEIVFSIGKN